MDLMEMMDKNGIREFFSKNWMTHDAMRYGTSVQELGPEVASRLNKTAVRLMACLERKRVARLMRRPTETMNAASLKESRDGWKAWGFLCHGTGF